LISISVLLARIFMFLVVSILHLLMRSLGDNILFSNKL